MENRGEENLGMTTEKIQGLIQLFRPELPLAAGICTLTGQIFAAGGLPSFNVGVLGFLSVFCLSGAALILNDLFDLEVDRVNHPGRPLPSGRVTPADVIGLTIAVSLAGLLAALALGWAAFLVGILFWLIGFLYNWRYKETGLPGNLMVCASVAGTFLFGAITVGQPWHPMVWIFSLMAFCFDLGEEIAGDAMDMEGDKKRGSRSIALLKDRAFALRITAALWGVYALLGFVPVLLGLTGASYLVIMLVNTALVVFFSVRLLRSQTPGEGRKAMRGAYLGATLCVAAFLVNQLVG